MKTNVTLLGESRSLAVRRFKALEHSLRAKPQFNEFSITMRKYFEMGHAEFVPVSELKRPCNEVYYLPMHTARKESSTTSSCCLRRFREELVWMLLNNQLLVGPMVHSLLVDVLQQLRRRKVALTKDGTVLLPDSQCDLHRFVWREDPERPLVDVQMTRLTFGVSASSFATNMAMKQNALQNVVTHP